METAFIAWGILSAISVGFIMGAFWCYYKFVDCDCSKSGEYYE